MITGCGIMPKKVEFGQDKVERVPDKSTKRKELERQAVAIIEEKVKEAQLAAVLEHASTNIVEPLHEAGRVSEALGDSMGPPIKPFTGEPEKLAINLEKAVAKDNVKLDKYREDVRKNEGKKIEGTGWFQMNYFLYMGLVIGSLCFLVIVIRIAWSIFINSYPGVGVGMNILKLPGKAAAKGLSEVLEGGEYYKNLVKAENDLEERVKEKVLALFRRAQIEKQSRDTQSVIKRITN
jgi:hypothetical protein